MGSADKTPPAHLQDATITILRTKNVKLSHMKMVIPAINFLRFTFFVRLLPLKQEVIKFDRHYERRSIIGNFRVHFSLNFKASLHAKSLL